MVSKLRIIRKRTRTGVDVWALGVLLCELLTGRHPFVAALGPDHDNVTGGETDSSCADTDSDAVYGCV